MPVVSSQITLLRKLYRYTTLGMVSPIALHWRTAYAKHAEELEKQCNAVDAHQYHLLVRDLDEHLANMDLLKFAMEDGGRTPLFLQLPSTPYDEVITNEYGGPSVLDVP